LTFLIDGCYVDAAKISGGESGLMDYLVTGGAGFIGASIVDRLRRSGKSVVCMDVGPLGRISHLADDPDLEVARIDVLDAAAVDSLVSRCGAVLHLAAVVGVDEYMRQPANVLDVNILGTRNVLSSCVRHGRPVVVASSSEVFGNNTDVLAERSPKVYGDLENTRWSYALSKAVSEMYAQALGRNGLSFVIVRFFNVYGPTMDSLGQGRVISKFLGCLRDGRPLPLVDGGRAVRSFCYIDDAVEATLRLLYGVNEPSISRKSFNIGRVDPVSMRELAKTMIRLSGHGAGTEDIDGTSFFGKGFEEIEHRTPAVDALAEAVDFRAEIDLIDGLTRTLAHWKLLRDPAPEEVVPPAPDRSAQGLLPFVRPVIPVDEALKETLVRPLRSGRLTNFGPLLRNFESRLAQFLEIDEAVVVSSGSDALLLSVLALNLGKGRAVLPSFTYVSTLAAAVHSGLEPVFCDISPDTWTMDPDSLAEILAEGGVRLVLPVNVFGCPPPMARIDEMARAHGAKIVYDNAHGFGTVDRGLKTAPEGDLQAFSLHATKVLPVSEGGVVVSADSRVLAEVRRLANHGLGADLLRTTPGYNSKMGELRAAVGLNSLAHFPRLLAARRRNAERLRNFLADECRGAFHIQSLPGDVQSNFQNLGIRIVSAATDPDEVAAGFAQAGVEARRYFWPPLHQLSSLPRVELPVTEQLCAGLLCLPLHSVMDEEALARVENAARKVAGQLQS